MDNSSTAKKRRRSNSVAKNKNPHVINRSNDHKNSSDRDSNQQSQNESKAKPHSSKSSFKNSVKKKFTLHTLVEKMKPNVEELAYRKKRLNEPQIVENSVKFFKCTKCQWSYKIAVKNGENISVHPFLGVLMCTKCCQFYGDGNFSIDSDGDDKYCRWCGEGGIISTCSRCIHGFCHVCLKKHFGMEFLKHVVSDEYWLCLFCNPKPLWNLRFVCSLVEQVSDTQKNESRKTRCSLKSDSSRKNHQSNDESYIEKVQTRSSLKNKLMSPKKRKYNNMSTPNLSSIKTSKGRNLMNSNSEESDSESPVPPSKLPGKTNAEIKPSSTNNTLREKVIELRTILKLTKHQMAGAMHWSGQAAAKLEHHKFLESGVDLAEECHKVKWFLSVFSSHLIEFCNKIEALQRTLPSTNEEIPINPHSTPTSDYASFSSILGFLSLMTNLVKTFTNEGIRVQDLLKAEIYSDTEVLGIKKNVNILQENLTDNEKENTCIKNSPSKQLVSGNTREEHFAEEKSDNESIVLAEEKASDDEKDEDDYDISRFNLEEQSSPCKSSSERIHQLVDDLKEINNKDNIIDILSILENA